MQPMTIQGERPFQVLAHSFAVSPSESGYTLEYSATGEEYTTYTAATPSDETLIVNGVAKNMFFRLKGNTGTVTVIY